MNQELDFYSSELEMLLMAETHSLGWCEPNPLNQLVDQGIKTDELLDESADVVTTNNRLNNENK